MPTRFYNGRESWVFRARALDELCGFHPELIGGALEPNERVCDLVYSPLRETTAGPFGMRGTAGSHALALTDSRVIISRDPHTPRGARTVRVLPYDSILLVELGEALTLGWLVFRFLEGDEVGSETIVFQSTGIGLFRTALRTWRGRGLPTEESRASPREPCPALAQAPPYLRDQVAPLLLDDEPSALLHSPEQWGGDSRRQRACVAPERLYAVSEHGLVVAESERPYRPGALVFGVNVTCIERRRVQDVNLARLPGTTGLAELVVALGAAGQTGRLRCSLDRATAEHLQRLLGTPA